MYTYAGKTAMITGASTGIGEVFARELAKRGMHVVLVARSEQALHKLADELTAQYGVRSEVIVADLSQEKVSAQVSATTEARGLHIDLLVNNAGFATYDAFEKLDPERDHQQVMLNAVAVVDLAHAFLPAMVERGEGAMITVSSMAAYMPMPYMAVYAASKAFVLSLSEALWAEYQQKGIRVTAVCPGQVETAFHQKTEHAVPNAGVTISAEEAVLAALQAMEQGKSSIIPGRMNRASIFSTRLMSRSFLARGAAGHLKPRD